MQEKSTLLEPSCWLQKCRFVSHKVQTTRTMIRGVAMEGNTQIVFMDTPGVFQPKRRLDRAMVTCCRILEALKEVPQPKWLILNKVDMMDPPDLLALTTELNKRLDFDQTYMISALNGSGCKDLLEALAEQLPEGPYYYPEDQISDLPMRMLGF
ncbi:GTPase Era [Nymphon striatum]|nr:GTPase Era [Nymphon striatum]